MANIVYRQMPASRELPRQIPAPRGKARMQKPQGGGKFLVQIHGGGGGGARGGMVVYEIDTCIICCFLAATSQRSSSRKNTRPTMPTTNSHEYPAQLFAFSSQPLIFSILFCKVDCRTVKNQYSYCFKATVLLKLIYSPCSVNQDQAYTFTST